jgi:GntR family transcriptional regulator
MSSSLLFHVDPLSGVPIYRQLMDQVQLFVTTGRIKSGDFVPSVRQLCESLRINPMTVSKAWSNLERIGVLEHVRGQGMRVLAKAHAEAPDIASLKPQLSALALTALRLGLGRHAVHAALDRQFTAHEQPGSAHE